MTQLLDDRLHSAKHSPLLSTAIRDQAHHLTGWVVVDSLVDGMAMGGTRMTASVTEQEVCDLAAAMTVKLALVGLRIGGAKAGIVAVPEHRDEVLRAFGRSVAPLLHGGVYLGCDQGTTHDDRDVFFVEAGYDVRRRPGITEMRADWTELWRHLKDITGYGVAESAIAALRLRSDERQRRVSIQGFGTVGRSVAKNLQAYGHRIVAVADVLGTISDPDGLPVSELLEITDAAGTIDRSRLPQSVTVLNQPEGWLDVDAEVLVLAAGGGAIREDNLSRLRADVVVEGGNLCCTAAAKEALRSAGTVVVPDVVANVGGAAVTGCILTGLAPSDVPTEELVRWMFDWVGQQVRRNTSDVLEIASQHGADPVPELLAARRAESAGV
ncbi:Glu/Leu/Phe/Val dehydrogenase dimerization domain-containing protein [Jatrophihabitans sp.]|uniref:Glu/Leu/Phe/Val dehydrogenase dimerization domain-containing protein n=1 Tax=Jatrophihabitans sp. TaxID=1932789 RepID=UPI002BB43167|nr:Glu/Leu/Phe/Val dehydrogenase dimerization domain-containing protein [Jatrophihabitans sp.]